MGFLKGLESCMFDQDLYKDSQNSNLLATTTTQNITQIIYLLQVISIFTGGLFSLIPLLINYIYRKNTKDTWLDSHFRWQIQTFWFSSLFYFIGFCFLIIPFIGWILYWPFAFMGTAVIIIRVIKGWLRFSKKLPLNN